MSFECWILSHFIWSHRIAASLGNCSLHPADSSPCHPISSQLIPPHVFSAFFTHLIPSHVFSPFPSSSQLITTVLIFSHVTWAFLISSHILSAYLKFSQLFSTFLSSQQLMSAYLTSSHLFSPFLAFSKLFSLLLSWPQLLSARLTSSQLFSAHSHQSKRPLRFPETRFVTEKLLHTASFCTEKLAHTEAFSQRQGSFYTKTGKLWLTESFYTEQAFTHSKLLHKNHSIEQLLHAASSALTCSKLLHTEAFTHRSFCTERHLQRSFTHSKVSHKEAPTQKSLYTEKLLHT